MNSNITEILRMLPALVLLLMLAGVVAAQQPSPGAQTLAGLPFESCSG